ncbi:MAG TPA: B12-binding domain-containing radical SAM protein [Thermoplasmatales archaeon]|nr:B12-binding domain-containing radical SAM protein [Thermoplasmatales archaeon]
MDILLISPHPNPKRNFFDRFTYPSLTLQQIAGITPPKHLVTIVDERYEDINFNKHYDLVGISCMTFNSIRGYEIADEFRRRGIPVVFGGYHATLLPEETKKHADSVVIGEAELTWPRLLKDLERGELKPFYRAEKLVPPEQIPPARHDIGVYTVMEAIQASRGCPVGCEFCAMQKVEGPVFRGRPIKNIIEEMKTIKSKTIFFADASLTISPPYTKSLFREMASLNKRFHCFGNVNVLARDDELLTLAKEAGVERWYVGIESITQENIDLSGKRTNKVENYSTAIRKVQDHGMEITGFFMFGFDNDTPDIFDRTLEFMLSLDLDGISFSILTPYPGTRLAERLEKEGRILSRDWSRYAEGYVNFQPKKMTVEELSTGIRRIVQEYFSYRNILRRSLNSLKRNKDFKRFIFRFGENIATRRFYLEDKLCTCVEESKNV